MVITKTSTSSNKTNQQQQVKKQQPAVENKDYNLSFCGCGFLGIYHVGVASCFQQYVPQISTRKISGASVGGLVAVAYLQGTSPTLAYATTDLMRVAMDARSRSLGSFHPSFEINKLVRDALEKGLSDDIHLKANGKLHISLTRVYDGQNVIVSKFDSKEDVIQALLCSCFIPFWSGVGFFPKFKGVSYIDGGLTNNSVILDANTITVSPFAGEADICPRDAGQNLIQIDLSNTSFSLSPDNLYRLSHALLPPSPEEMSNLFEQGFADGIRFLQRMKLISCTKCLAIRSSQLLITSSRSSTNITADLETEEDVGEFFARRQNIQVNASSSSLNNLHLAEQSTSSTRTHLTRRTTLHKTTTTTSTTTTTLTTTKTATKTATKTLKQHRSSVGQSSEDDDKGDGSDSRMRRRRNSFSSFMSLKRRFMKSTKADQPKLQQEQPQQLQHEPNLKLQEPHLQVDDHHSSSDEQQSLHKFSIYLNDNCNECILIRQQALRNPLPTLFSDRIRDACDAVNRSFSNWIYSHRPIKYLSYLAVPYYIPVDITLALVVKFLNRLPNISAQLFSILCDIAQLLFESLTKNIAPLTKTQELQAIESHPCYTTTYLSSSSSSTATTRLIVQQESLQNFDIAIWF